MYKLKAKTINVGTGGMPVISVSSEFAKKNDLHKMDRMSVKTSKGSLVAALEITEDLVDLGEVGVFEDIWKKFHIKTGDLIEIAPIGKPDSTKFIRKKMDREELFDSEIQQIVKDIVSDKLTDVELTAFVSASYMEGLSLAETTALTQAIVDSGTRLRLKKKIIADKHCIGGVPGNRTTMLVVPIISSLGIAMPKTSSRAITSPSGTADTMEALADVSFSIPELTEIVNKINGCIVWGGAINLAAADDKLIKVRYPLSLDPEGMMLASIMAKKIAVGATHIVFDLPIGDEGKLQSLGEARHLEREFKKISEKFKMNSETLVTDGNEPIGRGIGPNLEARDVLWVLKNDRKQPLDLRKKSTMLAGKLLEMIGKAKPGEGEKMAEYQLTKGAAYKQMMAIIEAQGGNPKIKPEDLNLGEYTCSYEAEKSGKINNISNKVIAKIARAAGAPVDVNSGVLMHKMYNNQVRQGEKIFTVYSNSERNMERAITLMRTLNPIAIE